MRETLAKFQRRFPDKIFPLEVLKLHVRCILQGLDYLHSGCHLIHGELNHDNILIDFEETLHVQDAFTLEYFVQQQAKSPMDRKVKDGRTIYVSRNDFGGLGYIGNWDVPPKIIDFGGAEPGDSPEPLRHPIQGPEYHAPEVLLGTGWSYSTDIWNLGVMIWLMMENRQLFQHNYTSEGEYDAQAHLAEMIALLGAPPKELVEQERQWREIKWSNGIPNYGINPRFPREVCWTPSDFYGGPFFNSDGQFTNPDLIPADINLENSITTISGEEKRLFLAFASNILQWLPKNRKTAKELLDDPWLKIEKNERIFGSYNE